MKKIATSKKNPAAALQTKFQDARLNQLKQIKRKLQAYQPLEPEECHGLLRIIDQIEQGYDPREDLGIKKKRGTPSWAATFYWWMAVHYWSARNGQSVFPWPPKAESEKVAALDVSQAWGVKPSVVRDNGKKNKTSALEYLKNNGEHPMTYVHLADAIRMFHEVKT